MDGRTCPTAWAVHMRIGENPATSQRMKSCKGKCKYKRGHRTYHQLPCRRAENRYCAEGGQGHGHEDWWTPLRSRRRGKERDTSHPERREKKQRKQPAGRKSIKLSRSHG